MENTQNVETVEKKDNNKLFFISLFSILTILFVLLAVSLIFSKHYARQAATSEIITQTISPIQQVREKGSLKVIKSGLNQVASNSAFTVSIVGDSNNHPITGYDVVIHYDPSQLTFISTSSSDANYTILKSSQTKPGVVIVTASRKLTGDSMILTNTPLLNAVFRGISKGNASISLEYVAGSKQDSNLIDDHNTDVLGSVENLSLTIE